MRTSRYAAINFKMKENEMAERIVVGSDGRKYITTEFMLHQPKTLRLENYVNAAGINASDLPHKVVQKLQAVIDARRNI